MTINVIMNTTGAKEQTTRRLHSSRRKQFNNLEQKIEAVAFSMLSNIQTISPMEMRHLENKLIQLLFQYKGFEAYADLELYDRTMEEMPKADKFSLNMIFRCYLSAWKSYSRGDLAKAKTDPFLKHFNAFYKKRKSEIISEKLSETDYWNLRAREAELSLILKEAKVNSTYAGYLPQISVLNRDKFLEQLAVLGASKDLVDKAIKIYESNFVGADAQTDSEGEETDSLISDSISHSSAMHRERMMMYIADCVDRALEAARAEKNVFIISNLPYFVTLRALPYMNEQFNMVRILLEDFLDRDLLMFAQNNDFENEVELFSEYKNQQYNTARKKLRKVEKWLGEWAAKAA